MLKQVKHLFSSWQKDEPAQTQAPVLGEPTGNTILFLHDEADRELWYDLAPHINTLILRLPDVFVWKYYRYPVPGTPGQSQHEAFMSDLSHAFLFLPCTSAPFLTRFWTACQKDGRLSPLLAETYVQPIALCAAHGVRQTLLEKPLAAYPKGPARDEACVEVIAALEEKVLSYVRGQGKAEAPIVLLEETARTLLFPSASRALH